MQEHLQNLLTRTLDTDNNDDAHIEHAFTFFSIALQIKAKKILELGVRGVISSWAFLNGLINNKKTKKELFFNDIVRL